MLNQQQEKICQAAVNWFRNSSSQVFEFEGGAGTGKTYTIIEILRRLNLSSGEFLAMAYTGQASIVMRTRGFKTARSIHSSLYEVVEIEDETAVNLAFGIKKKKFDFRLKSMLDPAIRLFFIDEAWMVPKWMVKDILSFGIKVICCGDSQQLPPIGDDPGFLTGYGVHRLTELMRQSKNNPIVYLANRAINGLPIHYGSYGNVLVIDDEDFSPNYIPYADTIICGTNKTRDTINNYVRQLAGYRSLTPNIGERIICRNNNWNIVSDDGIALCNGLSGIVASQLEVNRFNGQTFNISFKPDLVDSIFFNLQVNYEYFISPYDERQVLKEKINKYSQGELFEFAYAISCWLAQGSEYNNGIYIEEFMRPQIQNQLNYTGITRFKNSLIYIKKKNKYFYIRKE
jgi:exodeoxyribonuclease-5